MEEIVYLLTVLSSGKLDIDMAKKLYPIDEITVKAIKYDQVRGVQMGFEQIAMPLHSGHVGCVPESPPWMR